eukprot:CAMPEP_0168343598 /NCGR_PEP_ID=MMETSP0213-20121227/16212_1 /TAXON_ID=151035 /ORGANISM="Euplotes harpa, Strain FSP1.4" /LENGTH=110 /DNA_ID=CAMNT_0008350971 /DNA_START=256 /DNA_END=588 /DNA_ORIENTATION=-
MNGMKKKYTINKNYSFKVLMGKIKYELFQKTKKDVERRSKAKNDEEEKLDGDKKDKKEEMVEGITSGKGKFLVRFFHGEHELFENEKISKIGNGAEIAQKVRYDGGDYCL